MAHGHPNARHYTLGQIWEEAELVTQRRSAEQKQFFQVMRLAVSTIPSMAASPSAVEAAQAAFDRWYEDR